MLCRHLSFTIIGTIWIKTIKSALKQLVVLRIPGGAVTGGRTESCVSVEVRPTCDAETLM